MSGGPFQCCFNLSSKSRSHHVIVLFFSLSLPLYSFVFIYTNAKSRKWFIHFAKSLEFVFSSSSSPPPNYCKISASEKNASNKRLSFSIVIIHYGTSRTKKKYIFNILRRLHFHRHHPPFKLSRWNSSLTWFWSRLHKSVRSQCVRLASYNFAIVAHFPLRRLVCLSCCRCSVFILFLLCFPINYRLTSNNWKFADLCLFLTRPVQSPISCHKCYLALNAVYLWVLVQIDRECRIFMPTYFFLLLHFRLYVLRYKYTAEHCSIPHLVCIK